MGIRPEHILTTSRDEADFVAVVEIIEELGADSLAYLKTDFLDTPVVMSIKAEEKLKRGDQVTVKLDLAYLHLFDAEQVLRCNWIPIKYHLIQL